MSYSDCLCINKQKALRLKKEYFFSTFLDGKLNRLIYK